MLAHVTLPHYMELLHAHLAVEYFNHTVILGVIRGLAAALSSPSQDAPRPHQRHGGAYTLPPGTHKPTAAC
jgi:hypothetical protein